MGMTTAAANGLVEIAELLRCDVRLVASPQANSQHPVAERLCSIVAAQAADTQCGFADALAPAGDSC